MSDEKLNQPEEEQEDVEAHSPNLADPSLNEKLRSEDDDDVEAHSPNLNAPNLNAPNLN